MKPTIGRVVIFTQGEKEHAHNGVRKHPAIVTRVWGTDEFPAVNLTVFPDAGTPFPRTSVPHLSRSGGIFNAFWDWPPRAE